MQTNKYISDELLASYIDGTTTQEQNDLILLVFKQNPELFKEFKTAFFAANIFDNDSEITNISTKEASIIPQIIIGHEIFNTLNLFDHTHINDHSSMVAASNNHHADDRIHDLLNSISENNNHHNQNMETTNANQVIGENPKDIVSGDIQQHYNDTCAIKSQQLVLNDFGVHLTEEQLVQQAENMSIYHSGQGGTSPDDVGKLLELNGVSCTQHENATVYDLTSALAKGEKIIVGVDSSELWKGGLSTDINDMIHGEQADHALIVAGIDTTDPNNVQVILTDPGTGQEGAHYPIAQFLDAWHDSGNFMVTTDSPAPLAYNPEMINFDYNSGHLSSIGHLSYDYFDQTIMPLSQHIENDSHSIGLLNSDFAEMIYGNILELSPEMTDILHHLPLIDFHDIQHNIALNDNLVDNNIGEIELDSQTILHNSEHLNPDTTQNQINHSDDNNPGHSLDDLNNYHNN